jgi:hypothetical protein
MPAFRFFFQALETAARWESVAHETFLQYACSPLSAGRRKAGNGYQRSVGGRIPLPRTGGAPERAGESFDEPATICQGIEGRLNGAVISRSGRAAGDLTAR